MERKYLIVLIAVLAVVAVAVGLKTAINPYATRQAELRAKLAAIQPEEVKHETAQASFDRWKQTITGKPSVWQELIAAPPPQPPKPPPPPKVKDKLEGLRITRQGIGQKVRIMSPESPKGAFFAVGDTINGLTIKEITKKSVTFALEWQGKELTETVPRE